MKIDFTTVIVDLDKKPIKMDKTNEDMTMRSVCVLSLISGDSRDVDAKEKFDRARLAEKINDNDELDLRVEDITLLKDLIGKMWVPLVIMRTWDILDPPAKEESEDKDSEKDDSKESN